MQATIIQTDKVSSLPPAVRRLATTQFLSGLRHELDVKFLPEDLDFLANEVRTNCGNVPAAQDLLTFIALVREFQIKVKEQCITVAENQATGKAYATTPDVGLAS